MRAVSYTHLDVYKRQEFMRCFEKQDGVAFILISYTHRNEYYYLTCKKLTEFWDRAAEGGRKSFRYEELEPAFFLPEVPGILVPYLNACRLYTSRCV